MAEILVKAQDASVSNDALKDRRGCYKRGYPVVVMPDGNPWGTEERLPKFVVFKFPLVPVDRLQKYVKQWDGVQRRRWRIRWVDLPAAARNLLLSTGEVTIKARPEYTGSFDYTWAQVRDFFRNDETGVDETVDP